MNPGTTPVAGCATTTRLSWHGHDASSRPDIILPDSAGASAPAFFTGWTGVTKREGEAMFFIGWHVEHYGTGPLLRDLAAYLGCSLCTAHKTVAALRAKGFVNQMPRRAAALELTHSITPLTDDFTITQPAL